MVQQIKLNRQKFQAIIISMILAIWVTKGLGFLSSEDKLLTDGIKVVATTLFIYYAKDTRFYRTILIFFLLISALWLVSGTGLRYGPVNSLIMAALMGTDQLETVEFVKAIPWIYPCLAFLFILFCLFLLIKYRITPNKFSCARALFLLLLFCLSSFASFSTRIAREYYLFTHGNALVVAALEQVPDWHVESVQPRYDVYVVVIGESVSKDYMSLYNYPLQTTPFLDTAPLVYVANYIAPAPYTYPSLARTLALNQENVPDPVNHAVTLANAAGYETYWFSNQGYLGKRDTQVSIIAARSQPPLFLKMGAYNSVNIDDRALLSHIESALNVPTARSKVIFVHIMGSHQMACERLFDFPIKFEVGKGMNFDCYLASIEKTDDFLQKLVALFGQHSQSYSLMYFSDHGITIEPKRQLFGQSEELEILHGNQYQQNYSVPLLWISSDNTQRRRLESTLSGFDFIHLYANWLGISEKRIDPTYTLESLPSNNEPVIYDGDQERFYNNLPRLPIQ